VSLFFTLAYPAHPVGAVPHDPCLSNFCVNISPSMGGPLFHSRLFLPTRVPSVGHKKSDWDSPPLRVPKLVPRHFFSPPIEIDVPTKLLVFFSSSSPQGFLSTPSCHSPQFDLTPGPPLVLAKILPLDKGDLAFFRLLP